MSVTVSATASASVYAERRARVMAALPPRAVLLLAGGGEVTRNADVHYRYRAASDMVYLTGFTEPDAVLVLAPGRPAPFTLLVRPRDREREIWNGRRAGVEGARAQVGADAAHPIGDLASKLLELLDGADEVWVQLGADKQFDSRVLTAVADLRARERRGTRAPRRFVDPRDLLHEQRLLKTEAELAILRRAAAITSEAHVAAMQSARPGVFEHQLEAEIEYVFRRRGAFGPGYGTIVGAGANATVLHYVDNSAALAAGDLVLVDAGAEVDYYTADVTRTFPCGGRFSPAQRRLYDLVLASQEEAIDGVRAGGTMDAIHDGVVRKLTAGLCELGLLSGDPVKLIEDGAFRRYYMHRTSHWLGMDVHDVGPYVLPGPGGGVIPPPRTLQPGMVLTIEPGLYIQPDDEAAPAEYRGLGVRIEDDVVVTSGAPEVLTAACPKHPVELERLTAV